MPWPTLPTWLTRPRPSEAARGRTADDWGTAMGDEGLAQALLHAGIAVPLHEGPGSQDTLNRAWLQAIEEGVPHEGGPLPLASGCLAAWLQALPGTEQGQQWRNKALWRALSAHHAVFVELALTHGADLQAPSKANFKGQTYSPLAWALMQSPDFMTPLVPLLVRHGASLDAAMRELSPSRLRKPWSPALLHVFAACGMTVSEPALASRWLAPYLHAWDDHGIGAFPERQQAVQVLKDMGLSLDTRDALGHTPLQQVLAKMHRHTNDARDAQALLDTVEAWVALGANLQERTQAGDTLVHAAIARVDPTHFKANGLPGLVVARLIEANPGALTTPYADGSPAPAERLRQIVQQARTTASTPPALMDCLEELSCVVERALLHDTLADTAPMPNTRTRRRL